MQIEDCQHSRIVHPSFYKKKIEEKRKCLIKGVKYFITLRNYQYTQILTYGAVELTNQSIWKRTGLKLNGMDQFVSIVNSSLVYNQSRDGTKSSIYKTKAVFKGCSSVVDCICEVLREAVSIIA